MTTRRTRDAHVTVYDLSMEPEATAPPGTRHGRLNVKINEDTARAMGRLIVGDVNATEVVRRSVALLDLIDRERAAGKHVELVDEQGARERLRFLY